MSKKPFPIAATDLVVFQVTNSDPVKGFLKIENRERGFFEPCKYSDKEQDQGEVLGGFGLKLSFNSLLFFQVWVFRRLPLSLQMFLFF